MDSLIVPSRASEPESERFTTLHSLVQEQAFKTPDAVAVEGETDSLTYAQLVEQADRLALLLRQKGVAHGDFVGLCVERKPDAVSAILGILKAGAAFVPIDPTHPAERVGMIIEDAKLSLAVANGGSFPFIAPLVDEVIRVDAFDVANSEAAGSSTAVQPSDIAYVMFTYGSTGRPKGTLVAHANACALIAWSREAFTHGELDRTLGATSFCFDISIFEIFATLASGGTLVLVKDHMVLLKDDFAKPITTICACASPLMEIVRAGRIPKSVTAILQAGEALNLNLSKKIFAANETVDLWNIYGPTEATVYSTAYRLPRDLAEEPPIGKPLPGERCYVLTEELGPVSDGETGELFIAGVGVAQGYLDRPELTAERFLPDIEDPELRMYRTGDLVYRGSDGNIRYVGRKDFQVKISGYRIELGEIEVALSHHPNLYQVAVLVLDLDEHKVLAIYAVADKHVAITLRDLQSFLAKTLPHYMIPTKLRLLDSMPYGPTGKIDRKALRVQDRRRPDGIGAYAAPSSTVELTLTAMVEDLLRIDNVGIDDGFFDLGGKSLLATRFLADVERAFSPEMARKISLDDLTDLFFENPTIRALALVFSASNAADLQAAMPSQRQIVPVKSANPNAKWFFYLHGMYGGDGFHAINLSSCLRNDVSVGVVHPHGQHDGSMPPSIEKMAEDVIVEMRRLQPDGPYYIGGFCVGGLVAYEIAQQLLRAGEKTELLAMVSITFPERYARAALLSLVRFMDKPWARKIDRLAQILSKVRKSPLSGTLIDAERDRAFTRRYSEYRPSSYNGLVVHIWGDADPEAHVSGTRRWAALVPNSASYYVPGGHFCAEESYEQIAAILRKHLINA